MSDRITQITRTMADTLNRIPGYTGYRAKEDRRDADRRVRERVAADLDAFGGRIERVAAERATARDIHAVGPIGELASSIRLLGDRVRSTSYGYGGLFGDRDVDEAALDQLQQFDAGLLERVNGLEAQIAAVEATQDEVSRGEALRAAGAAVRKVDDHLRERDNVIDTGKPSALTDISSPLDVLAPASEPAAVAPGQRASIGDAVSFGGDNFVVDATIDVTGAEPSLLARIQATPERWLLFSGAGDAELVADLTPAAPAEQLTPTAPIAAAQATVTGVAGKSGERSLLFAVSREGPAERPVQVSLDWGQDALHLAGTVVESSDVEVYRRSA